MTGELAGQDWVVCGRGDLLASDPMMCAFCFVCPVQRLAF